ncbi:TetR family transcriptional regulator [Actinomadura algeriensis]|uniref:AcrR family transcriptional regulator n=1 Tax=Actinomadura algeriensis TaxID=1679523 RepID=A0ABR9JL49_9ACTN|nr:TetR family transcriptional regulator [Actinomadura algeriensis]MBE1531106.1 AcrR family transcriptional regulator [Actinomadura algeriensis]
MTDSRPRARRAPEPDERRLDAERTRRLLLDAALDEFSAKGFAGARVQDIADRAGVNKQLISYHFGGKEGLYRELGRRWLEREAEFNDPAIPLHELVVRYLRKALDDPRGSRLEAWRGLTEDPAEAAQEPPEDLSDMERRKAAGEIADDLDPGYVMLALHAMVSLPITRPTTVREVLGVDPASPGFRERYADQVARIVRHLAG